MKEPTSIPLDQNPKELAYDSIAENFDYLMNLYDLNRRVEVLVHQFLGAKISDKECLDMGCGTGHFSRALMEYGPKSLSSVDISPKLVKITQSKVPNTLAVAADLENFCQHHQNFFDLIVCSEVIEHTINPILSLQLLAGSVKPDGLIAISCPNYLWKWLLHLANLMKLRKHYQGYENWITPFQLVNTLEKAGFQIIRKEGIHLIPWQFLPKKLLRKLDQLSTSFSFYFALNLALLAKKK